MSWQNAPVLNKLTAAQQSGNHGAQLWGVDFKGSLHTTYQQSPGENWTEWKEINLKGENNPKQVYELAATRQSDGRVILFVLDMKQKLWTMSQHSPGGDWGGWERPEWDGMGYGDLKKLCAVQQGSKGFGQMWALTEPGTIVGNHQVTNDGRWFHGWYDWDPITVPEKPQFIEITAARQGNGHSILWGLDRKLQLWCLEQKDGDTTPPGGWGTWKGPNWLGAPKLRNIAACESNTGAYLWGIDEEFRMVNIFQTAPGSDKWSGWTSGDWMNAPFSYELTASAQNNGCAQVWAIDNRYQDLHSIAQTPRGWDRVWVPGRRRG